MFTPLLAGTWKVYALQPISRKMFLPVEYDETLRIFILLVFVLWSSRCTLGLSSTRSFITAQTISPICNGSSCITPSEQAVNLSGWRLAKAIKFDLRRASRLLHMHSHLQDRSNSRVLSGAGCR